MKIIYLFVLCVLISSCGRGVSKFKITGKWQIDSSEYNNKTIKNYVGMAEDRYEHYKNRIIEYRGDMTAKWIDGSRQMQYKLDEENSIIYLNNKPMKVLSLTLRKLVVEETGQDNSKWKTWYSKYSD